LGAQSAHLLSHVGVQAASHELKGLRAYFTTKPDDLTLPRLCVPIMSIIDYCGWRMIACCKLPIGKNTLCYGSAGQHRLPRIHDSVPANGKRAV
jgi:hypothetical protein